MTREYDNVLTDRECARCGKNLKRYQKMFCSVVCANTVHGEYFAQKYRQEHGTPVHYICKQCGAEFQAHIDRSTFCSRECSFAWMHEHKQPEPEKQIRACEICGKTIVGGLNKTCSHECLKEKKRRIWRDRYFVSAKGYAKEHNPTVQKVCAHCGEPFNGNYRMGKRLYCSNKCARKALGSSKNARQRRKKYSSFQKKQQKTGSPIYRARIGERDNWTCQLCGEPVDRSIPFPAPMSATLDHRIPVAKGGSDDPENIQLAHMICNSKKRDVVVLDITGAVKSPPLQP